MKLPNEALRDALKCLDRGNLDAVQFSSKRFKYLVDGLSSLCLRYLHYAGICEGSVRYTMQCARMRLTGAEKDMEIAEPEERAGERFGTMIASSYINELKIIGVPLTDALFLPMMRFLGTVNVEKVHLYYDDFENLDPKVLAEWICSFGSISTDDEGNLNVWITVITANLRQEHVDVLLRFNIHNKLVCDSAMDRYEAGLNRAKDVYGG